MSTRRRFVLSAALGTALTVAACNKPKDDGVVAPDGGGGAPTKGGATDAAVLAPVDHPSQLLPRGTAMLVTGTSVARAAEVLERDRLVEAFGPQYTSVRAVIVGSLGHDLLDPKAWPEVGLDPSGTVGLAVSDLTEPRFVFFATVTDRKKLVDTVRAVAGKAEIEMVEEPYASGASILRPKGENDGVVVLRDRFVAVIVGRGTSSHELAKLMVTMDPNVSLASAPSYRKATGGLRAADVITYLDVAGMVDQANAKNDQGGMDGWVQGQTEELERARKEGAAPERIAELERQLADARTASERWRRAEEGEAALSELVVSGIEGVGLTATVKRGGPVFDGRVVAGPEAFVRRLLANRPAAPVLTNAMNGAPLWCGSGRIDPAAGFELFEAMAHASGEDPAEFRASTKRVLGLDVQADLVSVLGGDAELCVAVDGPTPPTRLDPKEHLGVGAIVQTTDAAKAKYVLAKLATGGGELGGRMKKRGEGYTVDVPDWRTLHVQAVGDRVVVSTDPGLAKRLASGDPGSMPSKVRPPAAMGAMGLTGTAVSQVLDLSLSTVWTMLGRSSSFAPMVMVAGLTPEELEKVPHSAKSKKAKKAMEKARVQVDALDAKREAQEMQEVLSITDGLGLVVTAATEDDRGFTITGGQFLRVESLGRVLEPMLRAAVDGTSSRALDPAEQERFTQAWERWNAAQQAYSDARAEDGRKYLEKRGRAPAPVPEIGPPPSK